MNTFYNLKEALLDLLFPSNIYCMSCQQPLLDSDNSLCPACASKIIWINSVSCKKCGKPLHQPSQKICHDCLEKPHSFTQGFSCTLYDDMTSKIIKDFKFHDKSYYAKPLAHMLLDKISESGIQFDAIIPVPLHKGRKKERGYNQSELLSYHLSQMIGVPMYTHVLLRKKDTSPQNRLSRLERLSNIGEAFQLTNSSLVAGKSILLVDDVYTTGATMDACAGLLVSHHCNPVYVITCCIGTDS
ncbi:MAG: ComF family protein [Peptostreptococcales bacterium]